MIHLQMELASTGKFYQDIALFMMENLLKRSLIIRASLFSFSCNNRRLNFRP